MPDKNPTLTPVSSFHMPMGTAVVKHRWEDRSISASERSGMQRCMALV